MRHLLLHMTLSVVALQATANAQPATPPGPVSTKVAVVRKSAADSQWRRVWVVGSDSLSDTFVEPRQVSVTGDVVVVLDLGTREVHGLDARSGATRFVLKARGEGPGEFKRPARIASTPDGFVVLDHANARLTAYDRTARLLWDAVLDNIFSIDGLCVCSGPRIVTRLQRRDSAIVEYDTTGRRTAVRSFPWKLAPSGGVAFAYSALTSDASQNGQCVVAPIFGGEWGVATAAGPLRAFALKEPGPQAVVKVSERTLDRSLTKVTVQSFQQSNTEQVSRGAIIRGDTAIIYAADTKQSRHKLLDYYDTRTGEYLYSRKLPFIFVALTIGSDGTFYGTMITGNQQAVIALRPDLPKAR